MSIERQYSLVCVKQHFKRISGVSVSEAAVESGVHPELIDRFIRLGLIDPIEKDEIANEWILESESLPLIHKIIRLRDELGINYIGVGVVLDLLSRIDRLELRIREFEKVALPAGN